MERNNKEKTVKPEENRIDRPKNSKSTLKRFYAYLSPYKLTIFGVLILAIGSSGFNIVGPRLIGNVTTKIYDGFFSKFYGFGEGMDYDFIKNMIFLLLGFYLLSALLSVLQGFLLTGVAQKISFKLRKEMDLKIHRLPLSYFDKTTTGDVLSRLSNDIDIISQTLNQSISQIITSLVTIIGTLIMMFMISWQMTLIAFLMIPLTVISTMFLGKKSKVYFKSQREDVGNMNSYIEEQFTGYKEIKAFLHEKKSIAEFRLQNERLLESNWKSQFISGLMIPVIQLIGNLGYVFLTIVGAIFTLRKIIAIGDILAFIQYVRNLTQPMGQVAQISNTILSALAAGERVFEFYDEPEMEDESQKLSIEYRCGNIEFEHVRFGYSPDNIIIQDFSQKVKSGSRIAIVGPTGAGKTTIVKLLMRFYELNDGAIYIDETNIHDIKKNNLRENMGMVLQDAWLFQGTIRENIRYGRTTATDEEVIEAAKMAYADQFITTLPQGYDTILEEDAEILSQGQQQLITIARAILRNPNILILDEATSSVDTRTEIFIQKAFENLMQNKTSFVIAHRLSTIKNADRILVLKDRDIIESGTHEELLELKGFYYDLFKAQYTIS